MKKTHKQMLTNQCAIIDYDDYDYCPNCVQNLNMKFNQERRMKNDI